ncbi:MAG: META domain-containing protein [Saprospiraceae bacterium]|nr:META domain-containing protein [Saprospiraceae bacterium]
MMARHTVVIIMAMAFAFACSTTKKMADKSLYNTTWELEYLSGPRIAFDGLYPEKKPIIRFNQQTKKVEGNNSCNGYSADFTLSGENGITFGEPGPTTMMYCGQGEQFFLNTMEKINYYEIDQDGKLNLKLNDVVMMRFKKRMSE